VASQITGAEQPELSVAILSADLMQMGRSLARLEAIGVKYAHLDVMDGQFCPEITVGPWFVGSLDTTLIKDVHLLVADPTQWVAPCVEAGAGILTVHSETGPFGLKALEMTKELAASEGESTLCGVGVRPGSPVDALLPFVGVADVVYILGVEPGARKVLVEASTERVQEIRELFARHGSNPLVAFDGGVTLENYSRVRDLGPNIIVSGSAVFADDALEANLDRLGFTTPNPHSTLI
jgi:ribulose-phosphate 3-epimerase